MTKVEIVHWQGSDAAIVPKSAKTAKAITSFANQLSERDRKQLIQAFDSDLLEMGSVFVWTRTMAGLKTQLGGLGIDFIAEMLERPDIRSDAEVHEALTDYEAVRLAEELGMFGSTLAMRLRQNLEKVAHFSNRPADAIDDEMMPEEALSVLRTCVQTVLGHESLDIALEFAAFRKRLETSILDDDAPEIGGLVSSAYFFKRTVLRLLIAGSKGLRSAQLENVLANLNTLLPPLWPDLADPDRYMVGRAYAELHAEGQAIAANGIRSALLKVSGFDYVPEGFRSQAFLEAAARLQTAHFGWDNFQNEPGPMQALASLGTSIPRPAFHRVVTAIILVRVGNHYGTSFAAQEPAKRMLRDVTADRWQYFFDGCLPVDDVLLMQLQDAKIATRWCAMVSELSRISDVSPTGKIARQLLDASREGEVRTVSVRAKSLLDSMRTQAHRDRD